MRTICTSRFGEIPIENERIITFPEGLLGFSDYREYILIQHAEGSPFFWLQSADHAELAFVVIDPLLLKTDYLQELNSQDQQLLADFGMANTQVLALVTIPADNVERMTVNLLGPLLIDNRTRTGRQIILSTSAYGCRHAIISEGSARNDDAQI